MTKIKLKISGMSCAMCVNSIEKYLKKQSGIIEVNVNLANEKALVIYDELQTEKDLIIKQIQEIGYDAFEDVLHVKTVSFRVDGMSCASCAASIDSVVSNIDGVKDVFVNVTTDKMRLTYDDEELKLSQVIKRVNDIGYALELEKADDNELDPDLLKMETAKKKMLVSSTISAFIMILMVIEMFFFSIPGYTVIVAILAFPVIFILGFHVHRTSFKSLKILKPNMDVLVSLGSLPPYIIGLMGIFFPITTFIEMASTIMTFHLIGKFLESRAKGKASQAIKKLIELGAKHARIIVDDEEIDILTSELSIGDIMVIRPGEKIPSDGLVIEGESMVDESLATGESMPVKRKKGDSVIGATINKQGMLKVKVTKVGNDTFLAQIIDLVEACQGTKVPIQAFADKVTGFFVPAIMIITVLTFISFNLFSEFHISILSRFETFLPWINTEQSKLSLAFVTATAVLVIACPCALGLGTPTALMVGSGIGASKGILIRNGEAVQTMKDIKAIAFDKTGTLTIGKPVVTELVALDEDYALKIAASLEKNSEHVLAQAILEKAKQEKITLMDITGFEALIGQGVKGYIEGKEFFLGNRKLLDLERIDYSSYEDTISRLESEAKTVMMIADSANIIGIIAVADDLKDDVVQVIKLLEKKHIKTVMLTGDNQRTAEAIAKKAGIKHYVASILPDEKVSEVRKLQDKYQLVAMVGDGINDAPALKQANIGIALGSGTDVAIEAADITLVRGDLKAIVQSIELSKAIFKKIKENYFWAWFYNVIAIPFAMFGLLHPMIGAAAMSLSSLNVIYNSLRLKKKNFDIILENKI